MKVPVLVTVSVLVAALAGCIGDGGTPPQEGTLACLDSEYDVAGIDIVAPTVDPLVNMTPENGFDFETTNVRTCDLAAIGWSALHPDGTPHKYIGEIDMRGDLGLGAVAVLGNQEDARVYLVDISERAAPQVVSFIDQRNTYIVDVKISDDGGLLFTASQSLPTDPELEGLPELDAPQGFSVYDIADPAAPRYLTTVIDTGYGCHMMSHEIIDDTDVLFCISQNVRAYTLERTQGRVVMTGFSDYIVSDDVPRPGGPALPVNPPPQTAPVRNAVFDQFTSRPHDITVQVDPVTSQTLGIVSHWGAGLRVVDVADPMNMKELAAWTGEGATHYHGNVHSAMMFYAGEDRYIIASPEYTFDGAVPSMWVLNANDLNDLHLVAEWYHPGEHESQGLFLTTHQWQVAPTGPDVSVDDVRIYLTYNHGGIWVLDLGAILDGDNQGAILAFNLARTELDGESAIANAILATWDVNVVDGHIYGSDRATGLWVFHYAGDVLGDARVTGFA